MLLVFEVGSCWWWVVNRRQEVQRREEARWLLDAGGWRDYRPRERRDEEEVDGGELLQQ